MNDTCSVRELDARAKWNKTKLRVGWTEFMQMEPDKCPSPEPANPVETLWLRVAMVYCRATLWRGWLCFRSKNEVQSCSGSSLDYMLWQIPLYLPRGASGGGTWHFSSDTSKHHTHTQVGNTVLKNVHSLYTDYALVILCALRNNILHLPGLCPKSLLLKIFLQ